MAERRIDVKTVKLVLDCDKCGGEMVATGMALLSSPPQYPHVCKSCGHQETVRGKKYPCTELVEI